MSIGAYLGDERAWRDPVRRLGDVHLRISLARLPLAGDGANLGHSIVDSLRDISALCGLTTDGSVVAAFIGPRPGYGPSGDETMAERIRVRFERALEAARASDLADALDLTIAHCWSDEIYDVPSLALDLADTAATFERPYARTSSPFPSLPY